MSQDELDDMKNLFKSGDYIFYKQWHGGRDEKWFRHYPTDSEFEAGLDRSANHQIIHKKHKAIADEVIADPDVGVEQKTNLHQGWIEDNNFFENYQDWHEYQLAKPKGDNIKQICDNPNVIALNKEPFVVTEVKNEFADNVYAITNDLAEMLISKNKKYGNSALEPKRIFSKANAVEQILVRIDDKLSRMSNQSDTEDEDIVEDLLGYLVLLKIAKLK